MVSDELDRIEHKLILLNDMLVAKNPRDRSERDETLEELYSSTKSAQTRIQQIISDGENDERMERLLELNDLANNVMEKYDSFKKGEAVSNSPIDIKSSGSMYLKFALISGFIVFLA